MTLRAKHSKAAQTIVTKSDVSAEEPFTAMARLGLGLVQAEV